MKNLIFILSMFIIGFSPIAFGQNMVWKTFTDSVPSFSSPRSVDLTGDGVKDIVVGAGIDGIPSTSGIMAFDGTDGSLLWKKPAHDEIFVSANFQDINGDGVPDVFIGGREAQFYAIDGSNGNLIWQFYPHPYPVTPGDSGLWNFYSPQFIPDIDGDALPDLLLANGGDHSLPLWETNRPPGHLMVLSSATGQILNQAVVPDSAETYCSPLVIDLQGNGNLWVLYGTGGESMGGSFYVSPLSDLLNNTLDNSITLATHATRGFVAPPSVHKSTSHNGYDIIVQGLGGTVYKFDGSNFSQLWSTHFQGKESSTQPVIGNFTGGDHEPDVFAVLYKGTLTSYTDYYQVMLDGTDGSIQFMDSLGTIHFASGNAVDLNNDGRDEAVITLSYNDNGYFQHKLQAIDFQNDSVYQIHNSQSGNNLGCTPLIGDLDNNDLLDIVYVVRKDSMNPVGLKGIDVIRYETDSEPPNVGIAWGSYIGSQLDGIYQYTPVDCGLGSVISNVSVVHPSCNDSTDGSLSVVLQDPLDHHTFLWSTGEITQDVTDLSEGMYSVRVTNSSGCYEDYSVTLSDPYIISFGGIQSPVCQGDTNGLATVNSTGCPCMFNTCIFTWESGDTIASANSLTSGYQTVSIEHPDGCVVVDSVMIPEADPVVIDSLVSHVTCFGENDGNIKVTGHPNYNADYQWSHGDTTGHVTGLAPGNYELIISDNRPCYDTLNFIITEPDSLILSTTANIESGGGAADGLAVVTISGGTSPYDIQWDDDSNQTTSTATGLIGGWYTVEVIDTNGCSAIDSVLIETVSIITHQNDDVWIFYPNPANDILTIKIDKNFHYYILNNYGKVVLHGDDSEVNVSDLSAGVYILRLKVREGTSDKKLVIIR